MSRNVRNYLAKERNHLQSHHNRSFAQKKASDGTRFSMFYCNRVLSDGEEVGCPWAIIAYSASKIESVAISASSLALSVQSHYSKDLIPEGIECSNSCIYWVLRRCPLKSILER